MPPTLAFAGGAVVLTLVLAAVFGEHGVVRHEALRKQTADVERRNRTLMDQNHRLRAEAHALTSDPAYIEHTIKNELGWVRDDEVVFKFAGPGAGID